MLYLCARFFVHGYYAVPMNVFVLINAPDSDYKVALLLVSLRERESLVCVLVRCLLYTYKKEDTSGDITEYETENKTFQYREERKEKLAVRFV